MVDKTRIAAVQVVIADAPPGAVGVLGPEQGVVGHVRPDLGADRFRGMLVIDQDQVIPIAPALIRPVSCPAEAVGLILIGHDPIGARRTMVLSTPT